MLHHELFQSECSSNRFIVLIHGFGGNHKVWKYQIPVLQKSCNVLAIDLPSHFEDNIKLTGLNGDIESVTKEIIAVLDSYAIKNTVFIGLSLGTVFVKHLEVFYPQYVQRAILVGAIGSVGLLLHLTVNVFAKIGDKLPAMMVYKVFSKVIMPWKISQKSREIFCKCAEALTPKEFKAYMRVFKEHFSFNKKFIKSGYNRNLYISGYGDLCFLKGIQKEVKKSTAKLTLLKNCGHVCNIDQKEQFNEILLETVRGECL